MRKTIMALTSVALVAGTGLFAGTAYAGGGGGGTVVAGCPGLLNGLNVQALNNVLSGLIVPIGSGNTSNSSCNTTIGN